MGQMGQKWGRFLSISCNLKKIKKARKPWKIRVFQFLATCRQNKKVPVVGIKRKSKKPYISRFDSPSKVNSSPKWGKNGAKNKTLDKSRGLF